jgi:hypothetical protein
MHSGFNWGEGIRFGAVGFSDNIVAGRTCEVDGLPDDTPLQELCLKDSQPPEIQFAEPAAERSQQTPLHIHEV